MRLIYGILLAALILVMAPGCTETPTAQAQMSDFAEGAFPPIMTDEEYHERDWTRSDCLTCHESGKKDSPIMEHSGMPEHQKVAKCRTCHVLVKGAKAPAL